MTHRPILDVALRANDDRRVVGADHDSKPCACSLAEPYVADQIGGGGGPCPCGQLRNQVAKLVERHQSSFERADDFRSPQGRSRARPGYAISLARKRSKKKGPGEQVPPGPFR